MTTDSAQPDSAEPTLDVEEIADLDVQADTAADVLGGQQHTTDPSVPH